MITQELITSAETAAFGKNKQASKISSPERKFVKLWQFKNSMENGKCREERTYKHIGKTEEEPTNPIKNILLPPIYRLRIRLLPITILIHYNLPIPNSSFYPGSPSYQHSQEVQQHG